MKIKHWEVRFGVGLVMLSAFLYFMHYAIFRDAHHIFMYMLGEMAFVPIEVLVVTLIIHKLLNMREKQAMMQKLNMAIGVFFSEAGSDMLKKFQEFDAGKDALKGDLTVESGWAPEDFDALIRKYGSHVPRIECARSDLVKLREFLTGRRLFLLRLLENPNLLEHESFTDLLWALFHLTEELGRRTDLKDQTDADREHLEGDIRRAYALLITEWLAYMRHLQRDYPYLFSLAMRTNPFDPDARVELT
jgi:hypothetical protein